MRTAVSLFSLSDVLFLPFAIMLLYMLVRAVGGKDRKILLTAFWIHVVMVILHALVIQYYYGAGDTTRFYVCLKDLRLAVDDGLISFFDVMRLTAVDPESQLSYYFTNDAMGTENFYYMQSPQNFTVVKICYFFSVFFQESYLAISLCFSVYALIGSWLLCQTLLKFYPNLKREFFFAALFLPTVVYWSSSILKDPITFGSLGFIVFGAYQIFYRRRIIYPAVMILIASYLTYNLKSYVLLSFAPSVVLLIIISKTQSIRNPKARQVMYAISLIIAVGLGALLYQNMTSSELASTYKAEALFEKIDAQRGVYSGVGQETAGTAYFDLSSTTPALKFPAGLVATYYRPFPWEVGNAVMALSALESLFFLVFTFYVFRKVGIFKFFKTALSNPVVLFCFIFAILFGGAVGASTANFGSLVRYKIPSMPFYMIMLILMLHIHGKEYPPYLNKLFNLVKLN